MWKFSRIATPSTCRQLMTRLRCQSRSTESEANRELPPLDCGSDRKCEKEDEYFHKKQDELLQRLRENKHEVSQLDEKKECRDTVFNPDQCCSQEFSLKMNNMKEEEYFYNYLEVVNELRDGTKFEKIEERVMKTTYDDHKT
ncbi:uncharacterized protein LOC119646289 isoform X2 [Hermetia illucens]|uniref:uncharacterized protein LOC119646289 isoform X2 n=1 Tax=Hermetia illucens TaxID=343691 RepID=UPI0018CC0B8A|nr:uncharacterized protein LOC119646289 isoform X2 [Hermetia illucens]